MSLEPTGERVIEDFYKNSPLNYLIYLFHVKTYHFSLPYIQGKNACVLDYGCGSGYGANFIADHCSHITGVDISADAIHFASKNYSKPNLKYLQVPVADQGIPFEDASFDVVLSFQVIEHIADTRPYLSEIRRVLKPGGVFICATPDRSTRLLPSQKPWNMWHVYEYDDAALRKTLEPHFSSVQINKMSGKRSVLEMELKRTRKLMWATFPFTLPFIPKSLRVASLRFLKSISGDAKRAPSNNVESFDFSEDDLVIAPDASPSVNLVAIAVK